MRQFLQSLWLQYRRLASLAGFCVLAGALAPAQELRIAAAADLQFAMKDLAAGYQSETKQTVEVSYGSSGNFFAQIQNGAPFDLFFSADISYPQKLVDAGLAEKQTMYTYASGRIALWARPDLHVGLAGKGFSALTEDRVQKIAIANPQHAPYGKAAIAALEKSGIYDQVKAKLVYGENISQAAQFVQSGNAQVGIVALSLAISPAMAAGDRWLIPAALHPPLQQAAVVIAGSRNKGAAMSFLAFVKSAPGKQILEKYGFAVAGDLPGEARP